MAWTKAGREHEKEMEELKIKAAADERRENTAAKEAADRLYYANEEKKRIAEERKEDKQRASQERIDIAKANAVKAKADAEKATMLSEHNLKVELAKKQVEANAKDQEEQTIRKELKKRKNLIEFEYLQSVI